MKIKKFIISVCLTAVMVCSAAIPAMADSSGEYVALGADLTSSQRATVLSLMDLSENDLADINLVQITNQMERDRLGDYLPANVIGTKALSCVKVEQSNSGGINVTTKNISYCTEGMYQNALITAGIKNANVLVVAPTSISGTAGLVGAMEAYKALTGEEISESNEDAAIDEIVTTGEIADSIGDTEDAENLIALMKQKVTSENLNSEEDIRKAIRECASELGITLTQSEEDQILSLMKKIAQLDLSESDLKQQASNIYDRLTGLGIDLSSYDKQTFIDKVSSLFQSFIDFCKNIFS